MDALVIAPLSPQVPSPRSSGPTTGDTRHHLRRARGGRLSASNIRSDQVELGRITGEAARAFIESQLGGNAKIAIVQYIALAPETASQRVRSFKDEVTKLPASKSSPSRTWLAPEATSLVENMLTALGYRSDLAATRAHRRRGQRAGAATGRPRITMCTSSHRRANRSGPFSPGKRPAGRYGPEALRYRRPGSSGQAVLNNQPVRESGPSGAPFLAQQPRRIEEYLALLKELAS